METPKLRSSFHISSANLMAKKKTNEVVEETVPAIEPAEAPVVEAPATVEENPEVVEDTVPSEVSEAVIEPEKEVEVPKDATHSVNLDTLPVQAVDYLKRHPEVDAVYIDKFGGMFPKHTAKVFVKDAILYQNPYFKQ